jgi:hypothetical protein
MHLSAQHFEEAHMRSQRIAAALAVVAGVVAGSVAFADQPASNDSMMSGQQMGRFGGPVYTGPPDLALTASVVSVGGGPEKYSVTTLLTNMLGADTVKAEFAKLTKQYGADKVALWLKCSDFAVHDAIKLATAAGVKLPEPTMMGKDLAVALVKAGTAPDGTFQVELLNDKAVSHKIHVQVMNDMDSEPGLGKAADLNYHTISNQAFYDMAQALGLASVKLASLH